MKYLISFLVVIIFVLTALVSYFVGKQNVLPALTKNLAATLSPSNNPTLPSPTSIAQVTPIPFQIIKGGGILSFPQYQLKASTDWIYSSEA